MSDEATVYDLGEIDPTTNTRRRTATSNRQDIGERLRRPATMRSSFLVPVAAPAGRTWPIGFALFVPGSGHMLRGDFATGLCFLSWTVFLGTLGWAIVENLNRIWSTLEILGVPPQAGVWALVVLFLAAATVHVGNVFAATTDLSTPGGFTGSHPAIPAAASLVVPGWGQAIVGQAWLAAVFLSGCWIAAGAWILDSPPVRDLLVSHQLYLPPSVGWFTSPLVRWVAPAVLWTLATYDAALRASRA